MKPSKFNVFIPLQDSDGYIIFNTFTDSRVVVEGKLKEKIEMSPVNEFLFCERERTYLKELLELGFLVNDDVDEDLELEYWFQRLKFDSSILDITVLTTYACNLRCTYCYEDGISATSSMKDDICRKTILWIIRKLEYVRPRTIRLTFFGGEPLLNFAPIKMISEEIHSACSRRKIDVDIRIVTNGVLLTEDLIKTLKEFGLKGIKVTLDGDKYTHDSKRIYKDGSGTFDTIMKNLIKIKGIVPITIGGNFDDSVKPGIPPLLDRLRDAGFTNKDIELIRFKPIFATIGNSCPENNFCTFSRIPPSDFMWLKEEIEKRGFTTSTDTAIGPCEAIREYSYVIDPAGNLFKCAGFVGRQEFIIGNINDERYLNHTNTRFMTADLWRRDCRGCSYIPICGGGCRVGSHILFKNFLNPACEAEYINKVSLELVRSEAG